MCSIAVVVWVLSVIWRQWIRGGEFTHYSFSIRVPRHVWLYNFAKVEFRSHGLQRLCGTSQVVPWLRLHASAEEGTGSIPGLS